MSGGLDSRRLAGILDKIKFRGEVKAFSYGNLDCFDVIYGRRIAKKLNFLHAYIPIGSTYLRDNAENFCWLTEGNVNCLNAHMIMACDFIKKNNINTIVTGFIGDALGGDPIYGVKPLMEDISEEDFLNRTFHNQANIISENDIAQYIKDEVYDRVKGRTFIEYKSNYAQSPFENRYFKSIYVELTGRQRRYTSFNVHIFEGFAEVLSPYTDNELTDFALKIPDVLAFTRYVHREMIIRYLPKVASVPWNKTRLPLNASAIRRGLHWRWERLNRNPFIRATIGRRYSKMNDNYLNTGEAIRTGSRDFVVSHVKDNPFLAEYFNMDRVHQMLDDHMSGKADEYGKITALLTLSLWHKLFIEKTTKQ